MLPDRGALLVSREHGGNLVVNPPRTVWERSELTPAELTQFGFLVSAADRAMLDVRPQLGRGCINCWEAGNWALNDEAEPKGRKDARGIARCTCICSGEARRGRIRRGARASRHGFRRSRRRIHGPRIVNGQSPHVCAECRPS
jgi:hypothetical protein